MNLLQKLAAKGKISPPIWLPASTHYLVMMGSRAYGTDTEGADIDLYGFCVPPKKTIWPHLNGDIPGFGRQQKRFEQFQQHHVDCAESPYQYDIAIYSIVKFFQLCMDNNPNIIDALFVPSRCVLKASSIGEHVRAHRKSFLHKGSYHRFRGYAYSQLHKLEPRFKEGKQVLPESSKRRQSVIKHGYDTKFAYHLVRLLLEAEQILGEGDLHLDRHSNLLQAIRDGAWTLEQIKDFFHKKEAELKHLYDVSIALPYRPNEIMLKRLLLECLERHFGTVPVRVTRDDEIHAVLDDIK